MRKYCRTILLGIGMGLMATTLLKAQPTHHYLYITHPNWELNGELSRAAGFRIHGKFEYKPGHWRRFRVTATRSGQHEIQIHNPPSHPQQYRIKIHGQHWEYNLPSLRWNADYYLETPKEGTQFEFEEQEGAAPPVRLVSAVEPS